ncbi:neuromedin-U receptor 2-like [Acanthaster planci]|uniref:Neuromedin-U receptor 2-like n=1 Tax=Acanthaster planci TaxID=133434 RepID=A0A8B7ZDG3_ACAPL|nr:neuromedin-U receptor 2-like [Acanthaster planci]
MFTGDVYLNLPTGLREELASMRNQTTTNDQKLTVTLSLRLDLKMAQLNVSSTVESGMIASPELMNVTDYTDSLKVSAHIPSLPTLSDDLVFQTGITIAFLVAYGIVMVPAILGNLFIIFAVVCYRELRSQHSNIYNINLAVCDLMVVVAECPLFIVQFLIRGETAAAFFTNAVCHLTFFVSGFFGTCCILTMLAIGVERYCAVMHPLQMIGENKSTRARGVIFFFWSFSILTHLGQMAIFGEVKVFHYINSAGESFNVTICMSSRPEKKQVFAHIYASTIFILVYGSTFLTTLFLYLRILRHLIKRKHISPDQLLKTGDAPPTRRGDKTKGNSVAPKACTEAVQKTFRMLTCSVLSYLICYSLYFYINLYYIYYGLSEWNGVTLILLGNWFGALNSLINPIVYVVFVGRFWNVVKASLTRRSSALSHPTRVLPGRGRRVPRPRHMAGSTRQSPRIATIDGLNAELGRL